MCTGRASAQCGPTGPVNAKNTACGTAALSKVTTGTRDSAFGSNALGSNTRSSRNTASGTGALNHNTTGNGNTASGFEALYFNTTGVENTAYGDGALGFNTTGDNNIGIGEGAGGYIVTGSNNIDIGNLGANNESNTIRIGDNSTQTATYIAGISGSGVSSSNTVCVSGSDQLGLCTSSARYKRDIKDMGASSGALLKLRPVTFRYQQDKSQERQYGLVAEEVQRLYPELVTLDASGRPISVHYQELIPMLLNELQKQNRESQVQSTELQQQREALQKRAAENQQQAAYIQQQAEQIQSLSAQVRSNERKVTELQATHERELRTLEASFEQRLSALEQANHTATLRPATLMR